MASICRRAGSAALGFGWLIVSLAPTGALAASDDGVLLQRKASDPTFEVAAVRLHETGDPHAELAFEGDRLRIINLPLRKILQYAYEASSADQILGGPAWVDSERYDITAKVAEADATRFQHEVGKERKREAMLMLQAVILEHFDLHAHCVERMLPAFALTAVKKGPKVQLLSSPAASPMGPTNHVDMQRNDETVKLTARNLSMQAFAGSCHSNLRRKTGSS